MEYFIFCQNCGRSFPVPDKNTYKDFCPACEARGYVNRPLTEREKFEEAWIDAFGIDDDQEFEADQSGYPGVFVRKPPSSGEIMIRLIPALKDTLKRAELESDYVLKAGILRGGIEAVLSSLES